MDKTQKINSLVAQIGALFAAEDNEGGAHAAATALRVTQSPHSSSHHHHAPLLDLCVSELSRSNASLAALLGDCLPDLNWSCAGLEDGRIRPDIARRMLTAELIGPDGLYFDDEVRMGVFLQDRNLNYVTRCHAAEETFVMLGGSGFWGTNNEPKIARQSGDYIHHPSFLPHACQTQSKPIIAAWRWSGDIGWDSYQMTG